MALRFRRWRPELFSRGTHHGSRPWHQVEQRLPKSIRDDPRTHAVSAFCWVWARAIGGEPHSEEADTASKTHDPLQRTASAVARERGASAGARLRVTPVACSTARPILTAHTVDCWQPRRSLKCRSTLQVEGRDTKLRGGTFSRHNGFDDTTGLTRERQATASHKNDQPGPQGP